MGVGLFESLVEKRMAVTDDLQTAEYRLGYQQVE